MIITGSKQTGSRKTAPREADSAQAPDIEGDRGRGDKQAKRQTERQTTRTCESTIRCTDISKFYPVARRTIIRSLYILIRLYKASPNIIRLYTAV